MKRAYIEKEPSIKQLADIHTLAERHAVLIDRLNSTACLLIALGLPSLLNVLITPGSWFHSLYLMFLTNVDKNSYHNKWMKEAPNQISPYLEGLVRTVNLTDHQMMIVDILDAHHQKFDSLYSIRAIQQVGGSIVGRRVYEFFDREALFLETGSMTVVVNGVPTAITFERTEEQKWEEKKKVAGYIFGLSTIIKRPQINFVYQKVAKHTDEEVEVYVKINKGEVFLKKSFRELYSILKKTYLQLIKEFNMEDNFRDLTTLSLLDRMIATEETTSHLIWISIISSIIIKNYVVYYPVRSLFQLVNDSAAISHLEKKPLTQAEAITAIQLLQKKNAALEGKARYIYKIFGLAIPLLALLSAIYDYQSNEQINAEKCVIGICAVLCLGQDGLKFLRKSLNENKFNKNIKNINLELNKAVKCTGRSWNAKIVQGDISQSYFIFEGKPYKDLNAAKVNRIVQLVFNQLTPVNIISKTGNSHAITPFLLDDEKALEINDQIKCYLNQSLMILKLRKQIKDYFYKSEIFELEKLDSNGLPSMDFFVNCAKVTNLNLDNIESLFPNCLTNLNGDYVKISGYIPANYTNFSKSDKIQYNDEVLEHKVEIKYNENPLKPRLKTGSKIPNLDTIIREQNSEEKLLKISWEGNRIFDGTHHCHIKPVDHPVFRNTYFVSFNVPMECFPNQDFYEKAKTKINEGRFARSDQNSQGLQFRVGIAQDQTDLKNKSFKYAMRAKFLGKMGDVRLFAKRYITTDHSGKELILDDFVSVKLKCH